MEHAPHYDDAVPLVAVLRIAADELDADEQPKMVELLRQAAARIEELEAAEPGLTCARCGQKMEHKDQAVGCEDPSCPLT